MSKIYYCFVFRRSVPTKGNRIVYGHCLLTLSKASASQCDRTFILVQNHLLEGVPKARQVYQFPNHTFSLLIKYLWLKRLTVGAKWRYCVEDYNFSGKMASGPYNYSYIFKYIIIGDMGVGKSCLLHQFTEKKCKKKTT